MKTDDQAWRDLHARASAELRTDFADRTLRFARGPDAAAWQELHDHAAAQIRPGFADRILRAVRALPSSMPSLFDQVAFSTGTAVVCLLAVVYLHGRSVKLQDERNLLGWRQLAAETQDFDSVP